jgi:hypothetical protein
MTLEECQALKAGELIGHGGILQVVENDTAGQSV